MLGAISTPFFTKRSSPVSQLQPSAPTALPVSPLLQMDEAQAVKPVEAAARPGSLLDLADRVGADERAVRAAYDETAAS